MGQAKLDNRKGIFLFDLPPQENEERRAVYRSSDGILHIRSPYTNDTYKESYETYIEDYTQQGIIATLRDAFNIFQAYLYTTKPSFAQRLTAKLLTPVPRIFRIGNFLDIACNTGYFISRLPNNWKIYGIEINKKAVRLSRQYKNIHVDQGALENFNPVRKFHFVRDSHVIEHITNYEKFISKLNQITNKGGYVLLYTPNSQSISYKLFQSNWC